MPDPHTPRLFTVQAAAEQLGLSPSAVYVELEKLKKISAPLTQRIGGRMVLDLAAFLRARDLRRRARRLRQTLENGAVPLPAAGMVTALFAAAVNDLIDALDERVVELADTANALGPDGMRELLRNVTRELKDCVSSAARLAVSGIDGP